MAKSRTKPTTTTQRLKAHAEERRRRARRNRILAIAASVLVVGGVLTWVGLNALDDRRLVSQLTAGSCRHDKRTDPGAVNQHAENVSFSVDPPSGGVHLPTAASEGDYSAAPTPPPDGQIVHAQEHGFITVWYRPEGADLPALQGVRDRHRDDVLLVPRPTLPSSVAATSWGHRLLCDTLEPETLTKFVDGYLGKGPEAGVGRNPG